MGDVGVLVINTIVALITVLSVILGFASYKSYKMKESLNEDERVIRYILLLEEAIKKLNSALRSHDTRLNNQLHELSDIKDRLDILEAGHSDTDIDYGTVDDNGNITEVWFEGKRYVPEDKPDDNAYTFYADGRVVAETTRQEEKHCCATCRHYRPGSDHTCTIRPWLCTSPARSAESSSMCNNYKKTERDCYSATKGRVDYPYISYKDMVGNGRAEELPKYIVKLNYLASDDECDELLKRVERLNRIYDAGLMSLSEYGDRLKEWMQNDS